MSSSAADPSSYVQVVELWCQIRMNFQGESVRCILFDLDGTLYDSQEYSKHFDSVVTRVIAEFLGIGLEEAARILALRRKEKGTLTRAVESLGMNRNELHRLLADRLEPSLYLSPDPVTRKTIGSLRRKGIRIGLVSNSGRGLVNKILDALALESTLFDAIITGTDVEPKPSHQPFLLAIERLGCRKENAVYVGDRDEAEMRPAHEIGMRTILIARGIDQKTNVKWAEAVISDLSELETAITTMLERT